MNIWYGDRREGASIAADLASSVMGDMIEPSIPEGRADEALRRLAPEDYVEAVLGLALKFDIDLVLPGRHFAAFERQYDAFEREGVALLLPAPAEVMSAIGTSRLDEYLREIGMRRVGLQRTVPGVEPIGFYGFSSVDILAQDGDVVAAIERCERRGQIQIITQSDTIDASKRLAAHLALNGSWSIELSRFDYDNLHGFAVDKIQPGYHAQLPYSCAAGVNIPAWEICLALELRELSEMPEPSPRVIVTEPALG